MAVNQAYYVLYRMTKAAEERSVVVLAHSRNEAEIKATYEAIPAKEGSHPFWVFVYSVTYQNGNHRVFNG